MLLHKILFNLYLCNWFAWFFFLPKLFVVHPNIEVDIWERKSRLSIDCQCGRHRRLPNSSHSNFKISEWFIYAGFTLGLNFLSSLKLERLSLNLFHPRGWDWVWKYCDLSKVCGSLKRRSIFLIDIYITSLYCRYYRDIFLCVNTLLWCNDIVVRYIIPVSTENAMTSAYRIWYPPSSEAGHNLWEVPEMLTFWYACREETYHGLIIHTSSLPVVTWSDNRLKWLPARSWSVFIYS